jgi:hypothetical protein
MMQRLTYSLIVATAILATLIANAQVGSNEIKHYEKDGLAFDYPTSWRIIYNSNESEQTVTIASDKSATQIVLTIHRSPSPSCDFQAESERFRNALTKEIATQIKAGAATRTSSVTTRIGSSDFEGTELHGVINHKPAIGNVYSIRLIDSSLVWSMFELPTIKVRTQPGILFVLLLKLNQL